MATFALTCLLVSDGGFVTDFTRAFDMKIQFTKIDSLRVFKQLIETDLQFQKLLVSP